MVKRSRKRQGITQSELAGRLGVNARQVRELTQRGMPRLPDGSYPFREAFDWYIKFRVEDELKRRPRSESPDPVGGGLDHREQMAKVLLAELKLRREEGGLITTRVHRARVANLAQQFAAVIRALPQYAPELVGLETMPAATVVLERIANEMLGQARGEDAPPDPDPGPDTAEDDAA